jgi:Ca-activated chloride channel family protein
MQRAGMLHPRSENSANLGSTEAVNQFYSVQVPSIRSRVTVNNSGASPLILPGMNVIRNIADVWSDSRKPADIYLVTDVSGSMDGAKLSGAKDGLKKFVSGIRNPHTRVCLISFSTQVIIVFPLSAVASNHMQLGNQIDRLSTSGMTALFDAFLEAIDHSRRYANRDHLKAVILLTDGGENASRTTFQQLQTMIRQNQDIKVYGLAYGDDADFQTLTTITDQANGFTARGTVQGVTQVYEHIGRYV